MLRSVTIKAMPSALSGRRAEAARNDERILESARAVFIADPGAPISAVAEHAGVGVGALYRRYESKEELLRVLSADGLQRFIAAAEAALADHGDPWEAFAGFMRRCVDADTNSLTQRLAGTFTPTEELYREAGRAQGLLTALFDRTQAAGAVRQDLVVNDVGLLLEQVAALRVGDAHRTTELRHRYLALLLDAVRAEANPAARAAAGLGGDRRAMESLTRRRLTVALSARQLLLERSPLSPAEAIRHLTPLQGQHPPAPFIALAARLEGFSRAALEADIDARKVVKTTIMRQTLHVADAGDFPAYAQFTRLTRMRAWAAKAPQVVAPEFEAELRAWLSEPRTNTEIREHVKQYDGVPDDPYNPILLARTLVPLVQLPPAGFYDDTRRATRFVRDPRPLPDPIEAAALVIHRYLDAFGPAQRRDVAAWAGVAQADFAAAWERVRDRLLPRRAGP